MRKSIPLLALLLAAGLASVAQAGWEEGVAAFKAGKYSTALTEFQGVVEAQPDWPGGHLMVGQTLLKMERPAEAERALRKSYDLNPNDLNTQLLLGQTYVTLKRYPEAVELLKVIKVDSFPKAQQTLIYRLRGTAYQQTGQVDRALGDLKKAAQMSPDDAGAQYTYGTLELSQGNTSAALGPLSKAADLDAKDLTKRKVYAQALLRTGREARGQAKLDAYHKAGTEAGKLVAKDPSFDNLLLLGEAQLGGKEYSKALDSFQKAGSKKPGEWLPNLYLGQAYTALQRYGDAVAPLDKALGQASSDRDRKRIQRQLGFVYEKQRKFDQAASFYNQAGDSAGAERVARNKEIAQHNEEADAEKEEYERLMAEEEELKKALEDLPGGGGGG